MACSDWELKGRPPTTFMSICCPLEQLVRDRARMGQWRGAPLERRGRTLRAHWQRVGAA